MTQPFFPCFEDASTRDDATAEAMRAQLRAMYQWIPGAEPGEPNVKILPPCRGPPPVLAKHFKAAANELQSTIAARARDDIAKIRERNAKRAIPGYDQLEVWPDHLAPYAHPSCECQTCFGQFDEWRDG